MDEGRKPTSCICAAILTACVVALLLLTCRRPDRSTRIGVSRGTLVLVLPSRVGLVICADKRKWNKLEGEDDHADKIHQLSPRAVFAISGDESLLVPNADRLETVFSLTASAQSVYKRGGLCDTDQGWNQFANSLKTEYESAHRTHGAPIETTPGSQDGVVWEIVFLYLRHKQPTMKTVEYRLGGTVTVSSLPAHPYITGETAVALRILRPQFYSDQRFSDLWGNAQIYRAWNFGAEGYPANVSLDDALFLAHTFIRASNERMHLIVDGPNLVGPTCDCGLLSKASDFRWLERDRDTRVP